MIYKLKVHLESPTLIGSGEGFGPIIDDDVVFDEIGIPYLPARRVKGCLRESADEIADMFQVSKIDQEMLNINLNVDTVFGTAKQPSNIYFSNFVVSQEIQDWLQYFIQECPTIISQNAIIDAFCEFRQQTTIDSDTGVAKKHFLKTIRVIKKGLDFYGDIEIKNVKDANLIALACRNLRQIGTKRNRGLGYVECSLMKEHNDLATEVMANLHKICAK